MKYVIPTRYKARLFGNLSYPVGAEILSEGLQEVPQISGLSLSFTLPSLLHPTEMNSPYRILVAEYNSHPVVLSSNKKFMEDGWYDENWGLTVFAVKRQVKPLVKKFLVHDGLPRVKKWLMAERTPVWKYGRKTCCVLFDEKKESIVVQED